MTIRQPPSAAVSRRKVAISRVVMSSRERMIALTVRDKGFLVTTLRAANEVRKQRDYFGEIGEAKVEQEMLDLASMLIEPLLEVVRAKVTGEAPVVGRPAEPGKVVNLMDALKQSLARAEEKKPAAPSRRGKAAAAEPPAEKPERGKRRAKGG